MAAIRKGQIDEERLKRIMEGLDEIKADSPGLVLHEPDAADIAAYEAWREPAPAVEAEPVKPVPAGALQEAWRRVSAFFARESPGPWERPATTQASDPGRVVTVEQTRIETTRTTYHEAGPVIAQQHHPPTGGWGGVAAHPTCLGQSSDQEKLPQGRDRRP